MEKQINIKKSYSLFTALSMITGIVIGSGIFFKSDNVLEYTNGNVGLGIIIFCFAALAIVFGSLTVSELAKRTEKPGGLISYAEYFFGIHFSTMIGWFQIFLYYPTLTVIVSWVVGIYGTLLFGIQDASLELQISVGFIWFIICYMFNMLSAWLGGKFQEISTIVKLIPLIVLGVLAFFLGDPVGVITNPSPEAIETTKNLTWLGAIGPIAFSFDGWIVSTSISNEVKNSKRNLPLALIIAPIIILILYLLYFVGISSYLGPEKVLELGDASVDLVATNLFGPVAAKIFLVLVIISVMGTVNGVILGYIRLPYALALKGKIPLSKNLKEINSKFNMPINSAIFGFFISLVWWIIHYLTMKSGLLGQMDISEIAIVMSYLLYIFFYYRVFKLFINGEIKNIFLGIISPILATIGSIFILFGGSQNPMFLKLCLPTSILVLIIGYIYSKTKKNIE